ncbi:MAG: hypothetical protein JOZ51_02950 [Chloroflexi bacterium]|nr:hypothetical protein [Chloroflexota bacterium]
MLRQRAVHLLSALRQLPQGAPVEIAPSLLATAPQIFKLAHIAVGDADSAAVLTADVLAHAPATEGAALRILIARLPQGWLSWPGACGPSEWLRLGLRREQADRLLSVLGEWDAEERIGLALYLLWDVRREDLDAWTGSNNMDERVRELIGYIGESLRLVEPGGSHDECREIAADLLEANDPQIGRDIRLHTIGCDACRRRVTGLRKTVALLRKALNVFFRAPLPQHFAQLINLRQKQRRQERILRYWKPTLGAAIALLLVLNTLLRSGPAKTETALAAAPPNATELLDQALNRFERGESAPSGVLHERIRVGKDKSAAVVERWYDYRAEQLRITVRRPEQTPPIFDLATDGETWIAYEFNGGAARPINVLVRNPEIAELMPLLRQLPFVGSFSETPVSQEYMDLTLLAQARQGKSVLLGTTNRRGRQAYVLSSVRPGFTRSVLTIDRETLSLLEARVAPDVAGNSQTERVWEAEVVEVLPRSGIQPNTFQLPPRDTVVTQVDPRQLVLHGGTNLNIDTAVRYSVLPVPEFVPGETLIAHLRGTSGFNAATLQMYESEWSTLAIVTPRIALRSVPWEELDLKFAHGSYTVQTLDLPQATMAWFVLDDAPYLVMQLYLWHALADETEREQMIKQTLDSLVMVDSTNIDTYRQRFPTEAEAGKAGSSSPQMPPPQQINRTPLSPSQATRRRYLRSKLEQTYDSQPPQGLEQLVR